MYIEKLLYVCILHSYYFKLNNLQKILYYGCCLGKLLIIENKIKN